MHLFAKAAITRSHRLGGLNSRNLFSHSSYSKKSKFKILTISFSPEPSLLWLVDIHLFPLSNVSLREECCDLFIHLLLIHNCFELVVGCLLVVKVNFV